jgi:hypothetical protein
MPYIIAVVIAAVLGVGFTFYENSKHTSSTPATLQATDTRTFKNGTYSKSVTYTNPKQSEYRLDTTLTVANNIVTDASIVYSQGAENDPNAKHFEDAYKTEVIGKSLGTINLSRVGGASLTTNAFNNALTDIKNQAQS